MTPPSPRSSTPARDPVPQRKHRPDGLNHRLPVILLLGFRQLPVRDQARVGLGRVVALGSLAPPLRQPSGRPTVMGAGGELLDQRLERIRNLLPACVDGLWVVGHQRLHHPSVGACSRCAECQSSSSLSISDAASSLAFSSPFRSKWGSSTLVSCENRS